MKSKWPRARGFFGPILVAGLVASGALAVSGGAAVTNAQCQLALEEVAQVRAFHAAAGEQGLTSQERAHRDRELALATKVEVTCAATATTTTSTAPTTTTVATTVPTTTTTLAPTTTTTQPPTTTTTTPPISGEFPDATNTGTTGTLTPHFGNLFTSADGQVIENLVVNGQIRVQHNNVIIRNVRVDYSGQSIYVLGNTGLLVEDCVLDGNNASPESAISEHNYTMRRCEILRHGEGPRINGNVTLEDNYIHSFPNFIAQGAHQDCIQITSGSNIVIRHNTCMMQVDGGNAAIMTGSFSGDNLLFENNLLAGGGYTVYCGDNQYTNVRVLNNHFSTVYFPMGGYYGPLVYCSQATKSGNVWHDGPNAGLPL